MAAATPPLPALTALAPAEPPLACIELVPPLPASSLGDEHAGVSDNVNNKPESEILRVTFG